MEAFTTWLLGSLGAGLAAVDGEGRLRFLTPSAREILRLEESDPIGRGCREVFAREPVVADLLLAALRGERAPSRAELALLPFRGHAAAQEPGEHAEARERVADLVGETRRHLAERDEALAQALAFVGALERLEIAEEQHRAADR
ncbi:MAG TPA: hypothetical protein VNE71_07615, partial [Myxococcota bacterium]|nr:hypothetical protein [Myxococcota bacterium]